MGAAGALMITIIPVTPFLAGEYTLLAFVIVIVGGLGSMTGALMGAGWLASPEGVNLARLGSSFFAPLLVSPLLAIMACAVLYPCLRFMRRKLGIEKET